MNPLLGFIGFMLLAIGLTLGCITTGFILIKISAPVWIWVAYIAGMIMSFLSGVMLEASK